MLFCKARIVSRIHTTTINYCLQLLIIMIRLKFILKNKIFKISIESHRLNLHKLTFLLLENKRNIY